MSNYLSEMQQLSTSAKTNTSHN